MYYVIPGLLLFLLLVAKQADYWKASSSFQLHLKKEILLGLLIVGAAFSSIELQKRKAENHQTLEVGSLDQARFETGNPIDQKIVGRWDLVSKERGKIVLNIAIYLIPLSLLLFKGSLRNRLGLFFIYTLGYVFTESVTGIVKGLVVKYRPFAYRSLIDIDRLRPESRKEFYEDLDSYDISNSFFSGDTSLAAFSFTFFAVAYQANYTDKKAQKLVWIVSQLSILLVCYYRALSGKHFAGDVLVGALVGSVIACTILKLHQSPPVSTN